MTRRNKQAFATRSVHHPVVAPPLPPVATPIYQTSKLAGGRSAGAKFVESTRLALLAVSLGGVETLVEHPASMSHALLSDEELQQAGIPPALIRMSIGIEDPDDLIADFRQALHATANRPGT